MSNVPSKVTEYASYGCIVAALALAGCPTDLPSAPGDGADAKGGTNDDGAVRDTGLSDRDATSGEDATEPPTRDAARDTEEDGSTPDDAAGADGASDVETGDTTPSDGISDTGRDAGDVSRDTDRRNDTAPDDVGPDAADGSEDAMGDVDDGTDAAPDGRSGRDTRPSPDVRPDAPPQGDTSRPLWAPVDAQSKRIAVGSGHTCALRPTSRLYCWGKNKYGQLGLGSTGSKTSPQQVSLSGNVQEIDAGQNHTCARLAGGDVYCWGRNGEGQLGNGNQIQRQTPTKVTSLNDVRDICAGGSHTCAIERGTDAVYCWGDNTYGQITAPSSVDAVEAPRPVAGISDAVRVTCGEDIACALRQGGDVSCWGHNEKGQVGDATTTDRRTPTTPQVPSQVRFIDLAAGNGHACGLAQSGNLWCWGDDDDKQLGRGSGDQTASPPGKATEVIATPKEVTAGDGFTCIRVPGGVRCWGSSSFGSLGNSSAQGDVAKPVQVQNVGSTSGLESNVLHSCALGTGGALYCWGANFDGQIGNGSSGGTVESPFQVF